MGWIRKPRSTGWRDVTDQLLNGWTADFVHVCRTGDRVVMRTFNLRGHASTSTTFLPMAAGFAHPRSQVGVMINARFVGAQFNNSLQMALNAEAQGVTPSTYAAQYTSWDVPGLFWPSSLPGSEVA